MSKSFKISILLAGIIFILIVTTTSVFADQIGMANPSAVYCEELGYKYKTEKTGIEEKGICIIKENAIEYDAWDFFEGKVGKEYSYCTKQGYDIETVKDGKNQYSREYSVCVIKKSSGPSVQSIKERKPVTELMSLNKKSIKNPVKIEGLVNEINPIDEKELINEPIDYGISAPSYFDWRNVNSSNWMTPVKDQGGCGSCWSFAAVGAIESKIKITKDNSSFDKDLSEQDLVSCFAVNGCNGIDDSQFPSLLSYIQSNGVTDEPCFPYSATNEPCSDKCPTWKSRLWYIDGYGGISNASKTKDYLIEKGPLIALIGMSGYFDSNGIYRCIGTPSLNHAVLVVGYNDTGGYWIVKNSWGSGWNGNGYFNVGYNECNIIPSYYIGLPSTVNATETNYCSVASKSSNYENIINVSLNGNERNSGRSNYSDFTNTTLTNLTLGNSYTLYVTGNATAQASPNEFVKAWIDFNNDKTFSNDEAIDFGNFTFVGKHTFNKSFTVPNNATVGETRMRVYLKWKSAPTPCENASYGEVEDYKIRLITNVTPIIPLEININSPLNSTVLTENSTWFNLTTNRNSTCNYGVARCANFNQTGGCSGTSAMNMSTNDGIHHSAFVTSLTNTADNEWYQSSANCTDGVVSNSSYVIFFVKIPNIPLEISIIRPINNSLVNTKSTALEVFVNKNATCKYSLDSSDYSNFSSVQEVASNGEAALWHFNESSGGIVYDSSGYGNNGTIVGSPIWKSGTDCISGNCLQFNGLNDYITVYNTGNLHITQNITLEGWVFKKSNSDGEVISKNGPYALAVWNNMVKGSILTESTGWIEFSGNTTLQLNTWYHLAMTYDGSNIKVYVNGTLDGIMPKNGIMPSVSQGVYIGYGEPSQNKFFNGIMDELAIYSRAKTSEEIWNDYQLCISKNFTQVIYNLSEGKHEINVKCSSDGNETSKSVFFTMDTLSPGIWTSVKNDTYNCFGDTLCENELYYMIFNVFILKHNGSEWEEGKWIKHSLDGAGNVTDCTNCTGITSDLGWLPLGTHNVTIYVGDYAGNENSTNIIFTIVNMSTLVSKWTLNLSIDLDGVQKGIWEFGMNDNATDLFDNDIDDTSPPASPEGFDAYFAESESTPKDRLSIDIKKMADEKNWTLVITVPKQQTVNIKWNSSIDTNLTLKIGEIDSGTGNYIGEILNMKYYDSLTFSGGANSPVTKFYKITASKSSYKIETLNLNAGWNLISVPLMLQNNSVQNIFDNKVQSVWAYENGIWKIWVSGVGGTLTSINPKIGYWVSTNENKLIVVEGTESANHTIQLYKGWNLIGSTKSISLPLPNPHIVGSIWGWTGNSYISVTDSLEPKKAYWIAVSENTIVEE